MGCTITTYLCISKIKLRDFALGSLIGMIPGGFINAVMGSSLENVASVQFIVALGAFILLALVPLIYMKMKKKTVSVKDSAS